MDKGTKALLDAIAFAEGHGDRLSYNTTFAYGKWSGGAVSLVNMTLDEVRALQQSMVVAQRAAGIPVKKQSSAIGRYQFIRKTFDKTRQELNLSGKVKYTPAVQDRMASRLLSKRGIEAFRAGRINRRMFQNNLSMEWASLPRATDGPKGEKAGKSHYGQGVGISQEQLDWALDLVSDEKSSPPDAKPHRPSAKMQWVIITTIVVVIGAYALVPDVREIVHGLIARTRG